MRHIRIITRRYFTLAILKEIIYYFMISQNAKRGETTQLLPGTNVWQLGNNAFFCVFFFG